MGIAVAEPRHADKGCSDGQGWSPCHAKGDTQQNDGCEDPGLHDGEMDSRETGDSTNNHGADKGAGKHPESAATELYGPESNRHHDDQMV